MPSQNYREIFCQRLKQARTEKGLSQKTLGILAGIDEFVASTRINRYEKGVHEADINTVQKLAEVLQVPLAFFYTQDECLAYIIMNFERLSEKTKKVLHTTVQESLSGFV